jgi:PAS domain S-box-containing protein
VADGQLAFLDVNPATSEIFEYSKDELLQLNFYDLLSDKKDEATIREQLSLQQEVDNKEVELVTKTKEKITGIISISNEVDDQGMPYAQGIIHDITAGRSLKRPACRPKN